MLTPKGSLLLSICVGLIVILLWHINRQNYLTECDRKINDTYYKMHIYNGDLNRMLSEYKDLSYNKSSSEGFRDHPEIHRINLNDPEKRIRDYSESAIHNTLAKDEDTFALDQLKVVSGEDTDARLHRSLTDADYDAPQQEGMSAPIDEFERSAINLQNAKKQEVYGALTHPDVDVLSELNL